MADVSNVKINNGSVYNIKDSNALKGIKVNGIPVEQRNGIVDLKEFSTLTYNGAPNNPKINNNSYDYTNTFYEKKIVFLHDYLLSTNDGITNFLKNKDNNTTKIKTIGEYDKPSVFVNGEKVFLEKNQ